MATVDTAPAQSPAPPLQRSSASAGTCLPPTQPRTSPAEARTPLPEARTPPLEAVSPEPHPTTLIGSVQRAMRLLEAVAAREHGAPAKQLAREAGLALPTAYHLLRTLVHEGYLCRDKGLFFLGEAAERLGSSGAQQKRRSTVSETLAQWRDSVGAPVYYAVYRDGEIEVMCVADTPGNPAVEEWADFRETGHAHAIGQCLLSQLDEKARRDHLDRYPVQSITPYTVRDNVSLLRRLERTGRMEPVVERQEYALGTVCAALPITVGTTAAAMAISLPLHQADRLLPAARQLQGEIGRLLGTLSISISI
ncbi:transcriptional regulator [Streptomyces olivochromogenes]|uniref:Glycerol operon regulatory protein n=1 Tax=Streptomyces olivochromogenes TaxID=1963 RepID=A0A250VJ00_STROL|nr:IclR family transcriptional regulator C-terminal domain-containing protein [Streptomyces olivochromogenes]GAX54173.1 transcriptional regulator [Streptomyces olivochromogenes]